MPTDPERCLSHYLAKDLYEYQDKHCCMYSSQCVHNDLSEGLTRYLSRYWRRLLR